MHLDGPNSPPAEPYTRSRTHWLERSAGVLKGIVNKPAFSTIRQFIIQQSRHALIQSTQPSA